MQLSNHKIVKYRNVFLSHASRESCIRLYEGAGDWCARIANDVYSITVGQHPINLFALTVSAPKTQRCSYSCPYCCSPCHPRETCLPWSRSPEQDRLGCRTNRSLPLFPTFLCVPHFLSIHFQNLLKNPINEEDAFLISFLYTFKICRRTLSMKKMPAALSF